MIVESPQCPNLYPRASHSKQAIINLHTCFSAQLVQHLSVSDKSSRTARRSVIGQRIEFDRKQMHHEFHVEILVVESVI